MNTVVIVVHPNIESSRINKRLAKEIEKIENVEIRYLYTMYPNFNIDFKEEQLSLEKADRIVLQFPFYWYSSPSLLKEWQDKVLTYGWAYGSNGNALKGKELLIAVSTGAKEEDYSQVGAYSVSELLRPFQAMANMTGLIYKKPFIINGALNLDDDSLEKYCLNYKEWVVSENLETLK